MICHLGRSRRPLPKTPCVFGSEIEMIANRVSSQQKYLAPVRVVGNLTVKK
jgi:hypothetical protein